MLALLRALVIPKAALALGATKGSRLFGVTLGGDLIAVAINSTIELTRSQILTVVAVAVALVIAVGTVLWHVDKWAGRGS